jgi:CheY-like chemotaxis protein
MESYQSRTILMVDDDFDDFHLARQAFKLSGQKRDFQLVSDGEELMDYLYRRKKFKNLQHSPLPCLILLDLNMPKKDGREVLKEMKEMNDFRRIPVVVFTTSGEEEDILYSYELGANSYIKKPDEFDGLVETMKQLGDYWLNVVRLPELPSQDVSEPSAS